MIGKALTLLLCGVGVFGVSPAFAAEVFLDVDAKLYDRRDTFYIPIRVDARSDCLNAATVVIAYDPREISVREVVTSRSIFTLWTQSPSIDRDAEGNEAGAVRFSGGIPGGYCGRVEGDPGLTNILADLVVTGAPAAQTVGGLSTTTLVVSPETMLYRHDGTGTPLDTTLLGAELSLTIVEGAQPVDYWQGDVHADRIAPELFEITLVEGPSLGHARDYIAFSTVDKQSGISHYEVLETDPDRFGLLKWFPREAHWVRAESPYVLRDQELMSRIMVRAVDRNGNERVVTYEPSVSLVREFVRPSTFALLFGGTLILVTVLALFVYAFRRVWKHFIIVRGTAKAPTTDTAHPDMHDQSRTL